jgi:hypothetical protein
MTPEPPLPGLPLDPREFRRGLSESGLVEGPASGRSSEGRDSRREVVLPRRLRAALERLNPGLPAVAIEAAIEQLTENARRCCRPTPTARVHRLLLGGVKVTFQGADGGQETETARVVDWRDPKANDFLLASQFWVAGDLYTRRCDLVGFVNGIPLVLVELKGAHRNLKEAYDDNLCDYRVAIPQLFVPKTSSSSPTRPTAASTTCSSAITRLTPRYWWFLAATLINPPRSSLNTVKLSIRSRSSRTRTTRSGSPSSARCGSRASMCRPARRSTSTSRCATTR